MRCLPGPTGGLLPKYQYTTVPVRFKQKALAFTRSGILQGALEEDQAKLDELGQQGWELVSTVPFSLGAEGRTDGALAFLKRALD